MSLFYSTVIFLIGFFFSSRRRHTMCPRDWSSDVCSSDLIAVSTVEKGLTRGPNATPAARVDESSGEQVAANPLRAQIAIGVNAVIATLAFDRCFVRVLKCLCLRVTGVKPLFFSR